MTATTPSPPVPELPAVRRQRRADRSEDPTAGNANLTALTALTLLLLFGAEIVTVVLGVQQVLTAHVVIGLLLTLIGALALGPILAIALSGHAGTYLALFPKHH